MEKIPFLHKSFWEKSWKSRNCTINENVSDDGGDKLGDDGDYHNDS